jgi:methionyl-tRNA synthetase
MIGGVCMKKTCYVTTPIYYSSGTVHIGNSYTSVVCDVFARFNRQIGNDTWYLTGMDEHGQKIEEAAKKALLSPKAYVDKIAEQTKQIWKDLNISYDDFICTSEERHETIVQDIFEKLLHQGDIYLGKYAGNYCIPCETFWTKTQLVDEQNCPDCGRATTIVEEESYFLNLRKYSDQLLQYIKDHPEFIQPETRKNEVVSFIESGLEDLCVSRTSFKWGVPVKSNPKHVVYVWIDALSNYISALGYGTKNDEMYQKYWVNGDEVVHVVGKDILRFHAIYWPIMLMALNVPIKFKLYAHGWILQKEGKMSKSKGNYIYSNQLIDRYGVDATRYYLTKEMPLGNDGLFSFERFVDRFNTDLANDLGNLVSRTITMIQKYFDGHISYYKGDITSYDASVREIAMTAVQKSNEQFSQFKLQNALNEIWILISRANKYIDETLPWNLAKDPEKFRQLESSMYHLAECLRIVAILIKPVLVDTSDKILNYLGLSESLKTYESIQTFGLMKNINVVNKIEPLFKRLDLSEELAYHEEKANPKQVQPLKDSISEITIEDFAKLDIRVGEVLSCEKHPDADKLLVSQIQVGDRIHQIVSGVAKYYTPDQMVGKKIAIITNLKPVKLRGILSEGMILAASTDKELEIVELHQMPSGAKIK